MAPRIHDTRQAKKAQKKRMARLYAEGHPEAQVHVAKQLTEDDKKKAIVFAESKIFDNQGSRCKVCKTVFPKHEMGVHINAKHGKFTTKKRWSCLLCRCVSVDQEGMYKHLVHSHLCSICEEFGAHLARCPRR